MNHATSTELVIFFADVAGSTRLYERLGDQSAHEKVVSYLDTWASLVKINSGRVIETVGDEIMCCFADPNHAIKAANAIQEMMRPEIIHSVGVRIGMHFGVTGLDGGHPFGDTVNVAARMAGLARGGQIITTSETVSKLNGSNRANARKFDRVMVKGKMTPIDTYELVWDHGESTSLFQGAVPVIQENRLPQASLSLQFDAFTTEIDANNTTITIGRSTKNQLVVNSANASRQHATIEFRSGHIIFSDHSTNGSYLKTEPGKRACDGLTLFLHREEWIMGGTGVISLGAPIEDEDSLLIHFNYREE